MTRVDEDIAGVRIRDEFITGTKPLRIAIWHNLPSGGGMRAMYDQVRGLVGRGHRVEVWCPPTANRSFLPLNGLVEEHVVRLDGPARPRRGPLGRRLQPYHEMVDQLAAMDRHSIACSSEIDRGGFDVLLAHPCQFFRATSIGRHVGIPSVLYLQEPYRWLYEAWPRLPWLAIPARSGGAAATHWKAFIRDLIAVQAKRVQAREELANVDGFDRILANSMFSRESILRAFGVDSEVCYLGVDLAAFHPTPAPKERYVVGLGNIFENKGLDVAVAGIGAIPAEERPDLIWIGNFAQPAYLEAIEGQARRLGVRFIPKVNISEEELVETLGKAAAMIYTSRLEPFGYAPLEANAAGTAVVGVAEGGVRETIRDGLNGRLVPDGRPEPLGQAIRSFSSDLDHAKSVGQAARRHVEEIWGLESSLDRLEEKLSRAREITGRTNGRAPVLEEQHG